MNKSSNANVRLDPIESSTSLDSQDQPHVKGFFMRKLYLLGLAVLVFAFPSSAAADCECTDSGRRSSECPPHMVCTTYVGDCGSGKAPLDVCTGVCSSGEVFRLLSDFRFVTSFAEPTNHAFQFGFEFVPPVLDGMGSVAFNGRTNGTLALEAAGRVPVGHSLRFGASVGATYLDDFGMRSSLGAEYFPHHISPGFIPFQVLSFIVDAGIATTDFDTFVPEVSIGFRVWL